jgi:hypothetical protein
VQRRYEDRIAVKTSDTYWLCLSDGFEFRYADGAKLSSFAMDYLGREFDRLQQR